MSTVKQNLLTTQSTLQWVRVSKKNASEWTTSTPVVNPLDLGDDQVLIENHAVSLNPARKGPVPLHSGDFKEAVFLRVFPE